MDLINERINKVTRAMPVYPVLLTPVLLTMTLLATALLTTPDDAWSAVFHRAGTCGGCHVESFDGWSSSVHAESISSERFRSCLSGYLSKENTDSGGYCFRCHAPAVLISGKVFEATEAMVKGVSADEGVSCIVCHSVESVKEGRAVYEPGTSSGYHMVKDLTRLDRARLCTTCHGSYKRLDPAQSSVEADEGFWNGIFSGLGRAVGTETLKKIDHSFSGATVATDKHWACPDMPDLPDVKEN